MNKKKTLLLIDSLQNLLDVLREELTENDITPADNKISINDLLSRDISKEIEYVEEGVDVPDILLNSEEERKFYERFNLGD
jgi:hypothetical protein